MHISVYPYIFISIYSHTYAFTHSIGVVVSMLRGRPLLQDGFPLIRGSASSAAHGNQDPCRGDVPCVQCPPSCREATQRSIFEPSCTKTCSEGPISDSTHRTTSVKDHQTCSRTAIAIRICDGHRCLVSSAHRTYSTCRYSLGNAL